MPRGLAESTPESGSRVIPTEEFESLVLAVSPPGTFRGDNAKAILNSLASRFHLEVTETMKGLSRQNLIRNLYQQFETTSLYSIWGKPEEKAERNQLVIIHRYLLEAAINHGGAGPGMLDRATNGRLARLADCLTGMCYASDYYHYVQPDDSDEIQPRGLTVVHYAKDYDDAMANYLDSLVRGDKEIEATHKASPRERYIGLGIPFDKGFLETYGFRMTDLLRFAEFVASITAADTEKMISVAHYAEFEKTAVQASRFLGLDVNTVHRIMRYLETPKLGSKWEWYKFLGNTDSVVFRPIVPFVDSGRREYIAFGMAAITRAGGLATEYARRGLISVGTDTKLLNRETTRSFEKTIRKELESLGYQVWHPEDWPCGEIDALAKRVHEKRYLVVEAKSVWPAVTASGLNRRFRSDLPKWERQLGG